MRAEIFRIEYGDIIGRSLVTTNESSFWTSLPGFWLAFAGLFGD